MNAGRRLTLGDGHLAARSGRGVRVAVVDSGIAAGHPHVGRVAGGVCLAGALALRDDTGDRIGHGTAVAAAIRDKAPEADLLAVKVFDNALQTSADVLARAIRWSADAGARLVNLSLGTPNEKHSELLRAGVAYAAARGALVVAALELAGAQCYPGALPGVAAVRLDWNCAREEVWIERAEGFLRLTASGYPRPIPGVSRERNLAGISFAVANATAFLALLLEEPEILSAVA
ncbi:MAG: subtilisin-like serine protease QhpE [Gemmatimonadaceae bacterium]